MISFDFFNPPPLFIEIGPKLWQVQNGSDYFEFASDKAEESLREILGKDGWSPRRRAYVALGARGISLRRMTLPPASKEELPRLLRLQIESEFPLPPDDLAWGWQLLGQKGGRQEALVAAIKKETLAPYLRILNACRINPVFTVGALARNALRPAPDSSGGVLHIGAAESELLLFEDGAPSGIRTLPPGGESAVKAAAGQIYLTGNRSNRAGLEAFPTLELPVAGNRPAALEGMKKWNGAPPLIIQAGENRAIQAGGASWKWAAAALLLLAALLTFPWTEAILLKPRLVKKLAAIQSNRARLPAIDQELGFLQFIKRSQPPYLDTMYLLSKTAPPGTSFESVTMSRRGDLTLRGKLQNAQQVTDFRSNLIQSAWFSSVVVEEQTPTPDRRVSVRMSAQVEPVDSRKPLKVESTNSVNDVKHKNS